jgi:diacylglycerol kinase (ATP)
MEKQPTKKGLSRLLAACGYSISGLYAFYRNETAFRQEALLFAVLLPVLLILPVSGVMKALLLLVNALVLIVELLNSALEAIVDKVSPEFDELARRAKDMGSAAVLLCLLVAAATWATALAGVFC